MLAGVSYAQTRDGFQVRTTAILVVGRKLALKGVHIPILLTSKSVLLHGRRDFADVSLQPACSLILAL